jgi:glycerophosphoryl diester phosphodiesterase
VIAALGVEQGGLVERLGPIGRQHDRLLERGERVPIFAEKVRRAPEPTPGLRMVRLGLHDLGEHVGRFCVALELEAELADHEPVRRERRVLCDRFAVHGDGLFVAPLATQPLAAREARRRIRIPHADRSVAAILARSMHRRAERPWVFGHRGAAARAPENTCKSFTLALDEGADGVELDVRDAKDETVVVVHDPTLARVAHHPMVVADATPAQLAAVDVGAGERVPKLDDVVDLVRSRGRMLNIEVKGDVPDRLRLCRAVARLLSRRSPGDRDGILVSSFRPEMLAAMRLAGARVPMAFLFDAPNTGVLRARVLARVFRPDGLHPQHPLVDEAKIAHWHARGCFVGAWTVDDPERARQLARGGIDSLITNDPRGILVALGSSGPIG